MENIYNANDVITKIKNSINYYDCRIKAWENVKRVSKKNGDDFTSFNRNFDGGGLESFYGLSNKFYIHFRDERGAYNTDYIDTRETVNEQFALIAETIAHYKEYKAQAEKDLTNAETIAAFTLEKLREINAAFKATGCRDNGSLYYAICGLIETNKYFNRV